MKIQLVCRYLCHGIVLTYVHVYTCMQINISAVNIVEGLVCIYIYELLIYLH